MRQKYYLSGITILLLSLFMISLMFFACRKETSVKTVADFSYTDNITGEKMALEDELLLPKKMFLINDSSVAVMEINNEYGVRLFKLNADSVTLIASLGRRGGGPNEVISNIHTLQKDKVHGQTGIWISDIQSVRFHPFDAETYTWQQDHSRIINLPKTVIPSNRCFVIDEETLFGTTTAIKHQTFKYTVKNSQLLEYDFYPIQPNPFDERDSKSIFNGDMDIKPDKSQFVWAYELLKSISIGSINEPSDAISLQFEDAPFPQITSIKDIQTLKLQYIRLYATDRYIYAIYAGKSSEELNNATGITVHVFKWDGSPYYELHLDHIINCLCVDEDNRIIYGIDPTAEENAEWYRFRLPDNFLINNNND